jgi:hypothetical protein
MKKRELAYSILYQIENFLLLQEIDYLVEHKTELIKPVLDEIYSNRSFDWSDHFPIISSATGLCTLFTPISYISGLNNEEIESLGLKINEKYGIIYKKSGKEEQSSIKVVLKTMRNAIAHLSDFESHFNQAEDDATLHFREGVISFKTKNNETLTFNDPEGFVCFMSDMIRAIKNGAKKFLSQQDG